MRFLQRLGWVCTAFGLMVLGGQIWADATFFQAHPGLSDALGNFRGTVAAFIQILWGIFFCGSVALAFDKYWGRWAVALSGILILGELVTFELLPATARGWTEVTDLMMLTWPGVVMGRGPVTMVVLAALVPTIIFIGLARRPSNKRRGGAGEHLRTRETDRSANPSA